MIAAFDSMLGGTILTSRKRHLITLKHQSKPLAVMSATCDPLEIWSSTPKAQSTPNNTVR